MDHVDIENCLESMIILHDTREQASERASDRYEQFGCPHHKQLLAYGDYTYNFRLPSGEWYYKEGEDSIYPDVVIERKMNLTELSGNLCQHRARFEEEFKRAVNNSAKIYLIVEDDNMEKLYNGKYKTKFHPNAFSASLWAVVTRYDITAPIFVKKEISGRVIHDILYRELKNRLECGVYG